MDFEGIKRLLRQADVEFPRLKHSWSDSALRGEDEGKDWVEKVLGWSVEIVERPRKKPAPEEVLKSWAREWAKEGVKVDFGRNCCRLKASRCRPVVGGWWSGRRFLG
jgi:hypothetical protein